MIIEVKNVTQLKKFISFPHALYKGDSNWNGPQVGGDLASYDSRKNPSIKNLDYKLYLFEEGGEIKGRIAAFLNEEYNRLHGLRALFFGLFECMDSQAVANALLKAVEDFARLLGMDQTIGPVDFTTNYTMGCLVEGFMRPTPMTSYNKPFYQSLLEKAGYNKEIDLYAFTHPRDRGIPERIEAVTPLLRKRYPNLILRTLRKAGLREAGVIKEIHNSAFNELWGYQPFRDLEAHQTARYLMKNGDPDLVYLAYDVNKPVGILIAMPDPEVKGRLRLSVLGVKPEYRGKGIEARLAVRLLQDAFYLKGYQEVEYSLVLENNEPMNRYIVKESGCDISRVYRIFSRQLV